MSHGLKPGQSRENIMYRGKNKDGVDTWRIEVYRGYEITESGKKRIKRDRYTFHGTWRQALKYKAELEGKKESGTYVSPSRVTFGEFLTRWLESTRPREVSERTKKNDFGQARKHIIKALGSMPLQRLTTRDIDDYYAMATRKTDDNPPGLGLSPATVRKHHNLLSKALAKAKAEGLIQQNPVLEATPPRVPKPKHNRLTQEQLDRLLEFAKTYRNQRGETPFLRWYPLLYVLSYTGMRIGEAFGLKWDDVDLDAGRNGDGQPTGIIYITQTFVERDDEDVDYGKGKSDAARRPIRIDADTVRVLRRHKKEQAWLKRMEGDRYTDLGLVFTTETGYPPNPSNFRNRVLYPLIARANEDAERRNAEALDSDMAPIPIIPRVTPHELRHTHLTLLLKAGVNPKIVQERAGHSSVQVTYDYYCIFRRNRPLIPGEADHRIRSQGDQYRSEATLALAV